MALRHTNTSIRSCSTPPPSNNNNEQNSALFPAIDAAPPGGAPADAPPELPFTLLLAVNKFDLLPTQATPRRIEQWARLRLKQAGLPRPDAVFPVSAATGFGVREMVARLRDAMGFRCDLWVVGAQNGAVFCDCCFVLCAWKSMLLCDDCSLQTLDHTKKQKKKTQPASRRSSMR